MDIERSNLESVMADIAVHYKHACDKHPHFADLWTKLGNETFHRQVKEIKKAIHESAHRERVSVLQVLNEEQAEFFEAVTRCDMAHARYEALDTIAVLIRMIDVIDGLQPFGKVEK